MVIVAYPRRPNIVVPTLVGVLASALLWGVAPTEREACGTSSVVGVRSTSPSGHGCDLVPAWREGVMIGFRIARLDPNARFAHMGLRNDDVLTAFSVTSQGRVQVYSAQLIRHGQTLSLSYQEPLPPETVVRGAIQELGYLMFVFGDHGGIRVLKVPQAGLLTDAGVQSGDVLVRLNGAPLYNPDLVDAALRGLREKTCIDLIVLRHGQPLQLLLQLDNSCDVAG